MSQTSLLIATMLAALTGTVHADSLRGGVHKPAAPELAPGHNTVVSALDEALDPDEIDALTDAMANGVATDGAADAALDPDEIDALGLTSTASAAGLRGNTNVSPHARALFQFWKAKTWEDGWKGYKNTVVKAQEHIGEGVSRAYVATGEAIGNAAKKAINPGPEVEKYLVDAAKQALIKQWHRTFPYLHSHTVEGAKQVATMLGLERGTNTYSFAGAYKTKGFYAYKYGKFAGISFFGTGGTDDEMKAPLNSGGKYRPLNPTRPKLTIDQLIEIDGDADGLPLDRFDGITLVEAKGIATVLGLELGTDKYSFAGAYGTKGLYSYKSGAYAGIAFFGTGATDDEMKAPLSKGGSKYRPLSKDTLEKLIAGCMKWPTRTRTSALRTVVVHDLKRAQHC